MSDPSQQPHPGLPLSPQNLGLAILGGLLLLILAPLLIFVCCLVVFIAFDPPMGVNLSPVWIGISTLVPCIIVFWAIPWSIYWLDQARITCIIIKGYRSPKSMILSWALVGVLALITLLPIVNKHPAFNKALVDYLVHFDSSVGESFYQIRIVTFVLVLIGCVLGIIFTANLSLLSSLKVDIINQYTVPLLLKIKKRFNLLKYTDFTLVFGRNEKFSNVFPERDLSESDLTGCKFGGMDLNNFSFHRSILDKVDFSDTNLTEVDLSYASLRTVTMTGETKITGICIDGWSIDDCTQQEIQKKKVVCEYFYIDYTGNNQKFNSRCPSSFVLQPGQFIETYWSTKNLFIIQIERSIPYQIELMSFYQYLEKEEGRFFKIVSFGKIGDFAWEVKFAPINVEDNFMALQKHFGILANAIGQTANELKLDMDQGHYDTLRNRINKFVKDSSDLNRRFVQGSPLNLDIILDFCERLCQNNQDIEGYNGRQLPPATEAVNDLERAGLEEDKSATVQQIKDCNEELRNINQDRRSLLDDEREKLDEKIVKLKEERRTLIGKLRQIQEEINRIG